MAISQDEQNILDEQEKILFLEYPWFYEQIFLSINSSIQDFFQADYILRFMGVSFDDQNVLFFGDEYFVNKISINKFAAVDIRISSGLISSLLDISLGSSDKLFNLNSLTDIEAMLIKSFTLFLFNKLESLFIKQEPNKKILRNSRTYNFTFFVQFENLHIGKIIISVPDFILNDNIAFDYRDDCFDVSCFDNIPVVVSLRVGSTRISLNDIKAIENGDVIMLEDSDVNQMSLIWEGNLVDFDITPNPALIISVDNTGGDDMNDNSSLNSDNMWDTILVDVVAEFDNFKLSLGELKQISEGLVIDVGSVYNSKVKLRVAKQVVASGELVILNDRYGVRIDNVKNNNEESSDNLQYDDVDESLNVENSPPQSPVQSQKTRPKDAQPPQNPNNPDENFNYSDFEIEDESI